MKHALCVVGLVAALMASAMAQPESRAARIAAQRYYTAFTAAAERNDLNAMARMMAPNYVFVDTQGKRTTRSQMLRMAQSMETESLDITVVHVQRMGNELATWVSARHVYWTEVNGRWTKMISTKRFAETLRASPRGWVVTMTQQLPMDEPWPFRIPPTR